VIVTYINERFVTDVRATGFGVGFSLSVIIPSFYAFYMNWLGAFMPLRLTLRRAAVYRRRDRHDRRADGPGNERRRFLSSFQAKEHNS
jgi:hypothetical protein